MSVAWDVLSTSVLAFVKLSMVFYYRRIFLVSNRPTVFDSVTIATTGVILVWLIVFCFLFGFQCGVNITPVWNGSYFNYCNLAIPSHRALAISDVILEIWILAIPIPKVILQAQVGAPFNDLK